MNRRVVKFAMGDSYKPGKKEVLGIVLFLLIVESIVWIFSIILSILYFLVVVVGQWIVSMMLVLPTGRYAKFSEDKNPRIPFWPKVFGRNIWLYPMIPPALWAHYSNPGLRWSLAILVGIGCAVAIPLFWNFLTLPVSASGKID